MGKDVCSIPPSPLPTLILPNICRLGWPTVKHAGGMQLQIRPTCQAEIPQHYTTDISPWHFRSCLCLSEAGSGEHFPCTLPHRLETRSDRKIMNTSTFGNHIILWDKSKHCMLCDTSAYILHFIFHCREHQHGDMESAKTMDNKQQTLYNM